GPLRVRYPEHAVQHLVEDPERVFRTRVVACKYRHVGKPGGAGTHHRPLATFPVAATAEYHDQFPTCHRAKRGEYRLDRAWLVRVIDERDGVASGPPGSSVGRPPGRQHYALEAARDARAGAHAADGVGQVGACL